MVVIHCNDCFWENVHAEVIGSRCPNVGRCDGAIGDVVHVEFYGHSVGYVDVKSAGIRAILNRGLNDLESSCHGSNGFCCLHRHLDFTNESRRLVLVFRLDNDVRQRARLGMAERVHDVICSSEIYVRNYDGQLKVLSS